MPQSLKWIASYVAVVLAITADPVRADEITSFFNTTTGYVAGSTVSGWANTDPGWNSSTWTISNAGISVNPELGTAVAFSPASLDGGLALQLTPGSQSNTWAYRSWGPQLPGTILIEQYVRLSNGGSTFQSRPGHGGTGDVIAAHWRSEGGFFRVLDGNGTGDGSIPFENTGFAVTANQWYKVSTLIDQDAKTWRFFVNDQEYMAPDPLNYRGGSAPGFFIDRVDYLSGPDTVWIDGIRMSYAPVPEPSSGLLLVAGVSAWLLRRRRTARKAV